MRTFAGVEMAFWYLLLPGVGMGMWRLLRRSRSRPELLFFLIAVLALAVSISLVVANLGTLFRLRLVFLLPLLIVAAAGRPLAVFRLGLVRIKQAWSRAPRVPAARAVRSSTEERR